MSGFIVPGGADPLGQAHYSAGPGTFAAALEEFAAFWQDPVACKASSAHVWDWGMALCAASCDERVACLCCRGSWADGNGVCREGMTPDLS